MVESLTVFGSREKASAFLGDRVVHHVFTGHSETTTLAVRIHRLPEIVSMGRAHATVIPARARADLHGKHTKPP
jgi:hypothetical protein